MSGPVLRLHHAATGACLVARLHVADSFLGRLRGLLLRPPLGAGEALWIRPCSQVHTHFMGYPIQVLFLDRDLRVLRVLPRLGPWRLSPWVREADSVLEAHAGHGLAVAAGERLVLSGP